jgi:hypothetical protein
VANAYRRWHRRRGQLHGRQRAGQQVQLQQDALQLQRERERRDTETDIFKKLAQTAYLKGGGASEGPTTINYGGQQTTLPSYGFGPRAASDAQKTAATDLETLLLERVRAPMVNPADERNAFRFVGTDSGPIEDYLRRRGAANGRSDARGNTTNIPRRGY